MSYLQPVAVSCTLSRGAFSGERVLRVKRADGRTHIGTASPHYCFTRQGRLLGADEPAPGKTIEGKVAARLVRQEGDRKVLLYFPDGEVVVVAEDQLSELREVSPEVFVQPWHPLGNQGKPVGSRQPRRPRRR